MLELGLRKRILAILLNVKNVTEKKSLTLFTKVLIEKEKKLYVYNLNLFN